MKRLFLTLAMVLSLSLTMPQLSQLVNAEDGESGENGRAVRTIMLYCCGSNLEYGSGMATFNLKQILNANFSHDDSVRVIVMTGGANGWSMDGDRLVDPYEKGLEKDPDTGENMISFYYNQLWEAKGADSAEYPGKMVLLDADGITGEEGTKVPSKRELMTNPETLKTFINYCATNYPADKYDLILWDHGGGPINGFGVDQHREKGSTERKMMSMAGIVDAVSDNLVTDSNSDGVQDGKFDFINFDACVMSSVELDLTLADWMDYYIASPETEPGYGQFYTGWLNKLGEDPDYDTYELGKIFVDDYMDFYTNGRGKGQDCTLSVMDIQALLNTDFTKELTDFFGVLRKQAEAKESDDYLFYDELASAVNSIKYTVDGYYDLGNFVSQLAITKKDVGKDQAPADNPYIEPAKAILKILGNEEILYGKGTKGIRAKAQFFMDKDGNLRYEDLLTSSIYSVFPPVTDPIQAVYHCEEIEAVLEKMPASSEDRKALLRESMRIAADYGLIIETGKAVNVLASEENADVSQIDYQRVKEYWMQNGYGKGTYEWGQVILPLLTVAGGETEENISWLNGLIKQQAAESITANETKAYRVKTKDKLDDIRIVLDGTNRRVVKGANMNITAELGFAKKYIENDNFLKYYADELEAFPIGTYQAEENVDDLEFSDFTSPETFLEEYLKWYYSGQSSWTYKPVKDNWYAIRSGDGEDGLHAASVHFEEEAITVPIAYYNANNDFLKATLVFKKSGNDYKLAELRFGETGNQRSIKISELKTSLYNIMTIYEAMVLGTVPADIPMSYSEFTITPENTDSIRLEYLPIDQLKDVDTLHRKYTVEDIYNNEIDITEKVENPEGDLVNIEKAEIKSTFYNGKAQEPVVTYNGEVLKAGTDYTLYKLSDKKEFIDPGDYYITLHGKGRFCGISQTVFTILMTKEQAAEAVMEAKETVEAAKADVEAAQDAVSEAIATGNPEAITQAYNNLVTAQRALTAAQESLEEARDSLTKTELALINDQMSKLEKQVEDLNNQLANISVIDISGYAVKMNESYPYTGKAIEPVVKLSGVNESCYTVTYANNTQIGTATVTIQAKGDRYKGSITKTFQIVKGDNTLTIKTKKNATVKSSTLKKKKSLEQTKVFKFIDKGQGTIRYKLSSAKKGGKSYKKSFKVNSKTGKVTLKKGLKKGTYTLKVKVRATGNANYNESEWKTISFKVKK